MANYKECLSIYFSMASKILQAMDKNENFNGHGTVIDCGEVKVLVSKLGDEWHVQIKKQE